MEFNAGIFSFTGTRSNPLNMLRAQLLTLPAPFAPAAAHVLFCVFLTCINELMPLTSRQGAFS
jgi:hypothetical protein